MKSNCMDPVSTSAIVLPVGLKGSIAVVLAAGVPFDPKEAYAWQAMQEDADTVPLPTIPSMTEFPSTYGVPSDAVKSTSVDFRQ